MKKLLIIFALAFVASCSTHSNADAERILRAQGFEHIELHGYSFFGCGENETKSTKFTACRADGQCVSGVLCSRLLSFKGITIRYD